MSSSSMDMATSIASATSMSMSMDMSTSTTMASMTGMAASASSTASSMDMGGSCVISMLWNWNTIDACFLSKSWHITSKGMFAGSCIGVICLVLCLEFLRRVQREHDRFIVRRFQAKHRFEDRVVSDEAHLNGDSDSGGVRSEAPECPCSQGPTKVSPSPHLEVRAKRCPKLTPFRPTLLQQAVRALVHMLQFAVAYFIMLLAMYYNGYILICIFIGAFLGFMLFSWDTLSAGSSEGRTCHGWTGYLDLFVHCFVQGATEVTGCCG